MFSGLVPPPPSFMNWKDSNFPHFLDEFVMKAEGGGGRNGDRKGGGLLREKNENMTQFHKKLARPLLSRKKWAVLGGSMEQKKPFALPTWSFNFFSLTHGWAGPKRKFRNRMGMNGPVQKKGANAQREKQGSGGGKSNLKSNPFLLAGKLGWRGS